MQSEANPVINSHVTCLWNSLQGVLPVHSQSGNTGIICIIRLRLQQNVFLSIAGSKWKYQAGKVIVFFMFNFVFNPGLNGVIVTLGKEFGYGFPKLSLITRNRIVVLMFLIRLNFCVTVL